MLWVKRDPGKGKSMLLCGITNELERASNGRPLAEFFCRTADARINTGTAVLLGLMYFLVDLRPHLIRHLRQVEQRKGGPFHISDFWIAPEITLDMLRDPELGSSLLLVDALDKCQTERDFLLNSISKAMSTCPQVKWIVSGRSLPDIGEWLRTAEQATRPSLEMDEVSVSAAVSAPSSITFTA